MKYYFFSAILAFLLSLVFCRVLIPVLRRIKAGQNILVYVKEHKSKGGTPTMGGIAFLLAATLAVTLVFRRAQKTLLVTLAVGLSYMIVGLIDDFLKRKHKENLGLKAWQKMLFQLAIAAFSGIYCFRAGLTELRLPFFNARVELGGWIVPFSVFVFVATVNAVNLTDGLDGLAAGSCVPFFFTLGTLIVLQNGQSGLAMLSFALVGALVAYLFFNVSPASVFMGDTGSLSLGGFAACIGLFSGNALYIAIVGVVFVLSVISVLVQVIYYKATGGKRVFLMAPIHHHFQEKGYSESKISYAYFAITTLLGAICIACSL